MGLHHDMAAATAHLDKPVTSQDGTSLLPGEYARAYPTDTSRCVMYVS